MSSSARFSPKSLLCWQFGQWHQKPGYCSPAEVPRNLNLTMRTLLSSKPYDFSGSSSSGYRIWMDATGNSIMGKSKLPSEKRFQGGLNRDDSRAHFLPSKPHHDRKWVCGFVELHTKQPRSRQLPKRCSSGGLTAVRGCYRLIL